MCPQMASAPMGHCEASLLWMARRKLGAVLWAANADIVLHRMQHLGGEASRQRSQQHRARQHFFPGGDPAAATRAHRQAANGFDVGGRLPPVQAPGRFGPGGSGTPVRLWRGGSKVDRGA